MARRIAFLACCVSALAAPAAPICNATSFPANYDGIECWGLSSSNATTLDACIQSCCDAGAACNIYQWCEPGFACTPANSCWIGTVSSNCRPVSGWTSGSAAPQPARLLVNLTAPIPPATPIPPMGNATDPARGTITFDSVSLLLDGKRFIPIIGEMQYARMDPAKWAQDLLLMREGGINTVGTYVFWIHHQEVSPNVSSTSWDWTGARSLRAFLQAVQAAGLRAFLRIGPWAHGECRNGGFPDWLLQVPGIVPRSTDPTFMGYVGELYAQIAAQMDGLYWKQGGPVIGAQIENEWGGSYTYLQALKGMAITAGIDVPFYTKTGWPAAAMPFGMLLPFFGGYADGFWDRALTPVESYAAVFQFASIGDAPGYPALQVEVGGGMTTAYHRRIRMFPQDMSACALVQLGSGSNGLGYYIYHGGHNPEGQLTSLEEAQDATGYNDLPVKNYDFYAPIGEFSQVHAHYHGMRRTHAFITQWGEWLAALPLTLPSMTPSGVYDNTTLRWSVRADNDHSGVVFINNHQRQQDCASNCTLPDMRDVQLTLLLPSGAAVMPTNATGPVTIPVHAYLWWPFNLTAGILTVAQATVSPIAMLNVSASTQLLLAFATEGIPAEVILSTAGLTVTSCSGVCTPSVNGGVSALNLSASPVASLVVQQSSSGISTRFMLLDNATSLRTWKWGAASSGATGDQLVLLGSEASVVLFPAPSMLQLLTEAAGSETVAIYPVPSSVTLNGQPLQPAALGDFAMFTVPAPAIAASVAYALVTPAGPPRTISIGSAGAAAAPNEDGGLSEWTTAAAFKITVSPAHPLPLPDTLSLRLEIAYVGDCARLYLNNSLIADNFYNGDVFVLGLDWNAPAVYMMPLTLLVQPLNASEPVYMYDWPAFGNETAVARVDSMTVVQRATLELQVQA